MKKDHEDHEKLGIPIDELREKYSALASEIEEDPMPVEMVVEASGEPPFYRDYIPGIDDFLARAETDEQCREIIEFCLDQGDINQEKANEYLKQLQEHGAEIFGKRESGFYDKKL